MEDLVRLLRGRKRPVKAFDLSAMPESLEHTPEDLTATVAAGTSLKTFQRALGRHGQWLPVDPPQFRSLSIGALIAGNWSGPFRYGYGTVRDSLIGLKAVLADGSLVSSGGRVVKNVAGFDLLRLFVGSRGSLGVIVEATFKLAPVPETIRRLTCPFASGAEVAAAAARLRRAGIDPAAIDGHNLNSRGQVGKFCYLELGLLGSSADVSAQERRLSTVMAFRPSTARYHESFWKSRATGEVACRSVAPAVIGELLEEAAGRPWLARLGNGVVYIADVAKRIPRQPAALERRLKSTFDPDNILPSIPGVNGV